MAARSLESEFNEYWLKLSVPEKQSLLSVARNYVELKAEIAIDAEQYNKEINEAIERVEAGEFFTHDEVLKVSKDW